MATALNFNRAAAAGIQEDKWLLFNLIRDAEEIPYTLTPSELANLIYNKLGFPKFGVIKQIDLSPMKSIRVRIAGNYPFEQHLNAEAIEIRDGLRMLPMKEFKRERIVKITRVPVETPDEEVVKTLSMFGEIVEKPKFSMMEIKETELDELTKLLSQIPTSDREVKMIIRKNIPSFVKIGEKKAKIW